MFLFEEVISSDHEYIFFMAIYWWKEQLVYIVHGHMFMISQMNKENEPEQIIIGSNLPSEIFFYLLNIYSVWFFLFIQFQVKILFRSEQKWN